MCELPKYNREKQCRPQPQCFRFFSRPLIYGFWRDAHDHYTNPLARPLLIALQVVRTSFGFHLSSELGVTISDDLRWNHHVADITGRANKLLGLLRRNLSTGDRRVKEAAYLGLVRPLLEYASQAWNPYMDNLSNEMEKILRPAARFVTSDYQNYDLGSVTTPFQGPRLEVSKEQERSRQTLSSQKGIR